MEKKDLAKHLGKSYQLEITRFVGTPPIITALAAGELEIADFTVLHVGRSQELHREESRHAYDFMEDSLRIARWYLDPANHQEAMEICARITKQPAERFTSGLRSDNSL